MEKIAIDWRQAGSFARAHGVLVITWRHTIKAPKHLANLPSSDPALEQLYDQEPGLKGIFVKGAPAFICRNFRNFGVMRGLANGKACVMHSISFRQDTASARARAHEARVRISRAQPGDIVDLGDLVPEAINVEMEISDTAATDWPQGGSLINPTINRAAETGTVVVPILMIMMILSKQIDVGYFGKGVTSNTNVMHLKLDLP